jgi:WD40 repeat protein
MANGEPLGSDAQLPATSDSSPSVTLLAKHSIASQPPQSSPTPALQSVDTKRLENSFFFSSAQWSADGTSALVGRSDNAVSAFVLPSDLLDEHDEARPLESQSTIKLPEPTQAIAASPYFSLAEPASQTFLTACRDHPIQLYHAFPQEDKSMPLCAYKLIRHETEEYISASSLLWSQPGTHFVCGSTNRLDYFDISRYGSDGPILTIPTIPSKRHVLKGGGVGMKGTVSALAASRTDSNEGIIAAGTRTRWMGLYDLGRVDKAVAHWTIAGADQEEFGTDIGGQGIMQTTWSTCGRYLIINERQSSGLLVYDIRVSGKLLSILSGRQAQSQQRLSCDIFGNPHGEPGFEVWAGDQTGSVQVWDEVGLHYGLRDSSWNWKAHDAPVSSAIVHPSGSVALTCSGAWDYPADEDVPDDQETAHHGGSRSRIMDDSSIKVWSINTAEGTSG